MRQVLNEVELCHFLNINMIHVWQKPLHYYKVISLKLIKINKNKHKNPKEKKRETSQHSLLDTKIQMGHKHHCLFSVLLFLSL